MNTFGLGDVGGTIVVVIKEGDLVKDLSSATNYSVKLRKPDQTVINGVATLTTDGADGSLTYIVPAGVLSIVGKYELQVSLTVGAWVGQSSSFIFVVRETLVPT